MLSPHSILEESLRSVAEIDEPSDRANAHIAVIDAFTAIGHPESARLLLHEAKNLCEAVEQKDQRNFLLVELLESTVQLREMNMAIDWLDPDASQESRERFADAAVYHYIKRNDLTAALDYAEKIEENIDDRRSCITAVALKMLENDRIEDALELANRQEEDYDRVHHLMHIIRQLWKSGHYEDSGRIFDEVRRSKELHYDEVLEEINILAMMHRNAEAIERLRDICPEYRNMAYLAIAESMRECGNTSGASALLDEALEFAKNEEKDSVKVCQIIDVARQQHIFGKVEKAKKTFNLAIAIASKIKGHFYLKKIAEVLAGIGERGPGLRLFRHCLEQIRKSPSSDSFHLLLWLADSFIKYDFTKEAIECGDLLIKWLEEDEKRALNEEFAYETQAAIYAKTAAMLLKTDIGSASGKELLEKSLNLARSLADPIRRAAALTAIGRTI